MKLIDILEAQLPHPDDPEFENLYHRRAFGYESPKFNQVVNEMMTKYPEYVYSGPMFRVVGIRMSDFVFKTEKQALQHISRQVETRQQEMQSWSSTMKGVLKYNKFASRRAGAPSHVAVILEQNSQGFDVKQYSIERGTKKVLRDDGTPDTVNHFAPSVVVDEVLAAPQNPKINGYIIGTEKLSFKEVRSYLSKK